MKIFSYIKYGLIGGVLASILYSVGVYLLFYQKTVNHNFFLFIGFSLLAYWWILLILPPLLTLPFFAKNKGWKINNVVMSTNIILSIPFCVVTLLATIYLGILLQSWLAL